MSEVTILGNGPSREGFDILGCNHEVWGCNAIYRDTSACDIVFAVDIVMQAEIVESDYYRGNLVAFADIDPLPIEMLELMKPGFEYSHEVIVTTKPDDTHFIIQGDGETTDFLGLIRPELIVTYNDPLLRNLFTGMSALGYAMLHNYTTINMVGFDALEGDSAGNIYAGSENYTHKYNADSKVLNAQRSQFIALLKEFNDCSVYFKNPLDKEGAIRYNELPYYEISEEWILGQGLKSEI
jgi:hypothetical protein